MPSETTMGVWAVAIGVISAISLPLGAVAGLVLRPRASIAALLAAFGAGALIAALAVELVAPTVAAMHHDAHGVRAFLAMTFGAVVGGVVFAVLDRALAERGGFLRKLGTTIAYHTRRKRTRQAAWLHDLCAIPIIRELPPAQVGLLLDDVRSEVYASGDTLFREGEVASCLFFVQDGEVELEVRGAPVRRLGRGGIAGEVGVVAAVPHRATARACTEVEVLVLRREAVARWRSLCPEFDEGLRALAGARLEEFRERETEVSASEAAWASDAAAAIAAGAAVPSPGEVRRMAEEHQGAPLAVWLGMLIDGVPESIVIGAGFLALASERQASGAAVAFADVVPYTLVAGLFLSNFPEALSSSIGMRAVGWSAARIVGLWSVLVVVTAVGAGTGYLIGDVLPHAVVAGIEGVAAGAMLTALASAVIPEAVHLGRAPRAVGLATLFGFLAAVSFKLLE